MNEYNALKEDALTGFGRMRQKHPPRYQAKVEAALMLLADVKTGRAPSWMLHEAIAPRTPGVGRIIGRNYPGIFNESQTRSDFAVLTGNVLNRMLLAQYEEARASYRDYCYVNESLTDFRSREIIAFDGSDAPYQKLPEGASLQHGSSKESMYSYKPSKYGKGEVLSFEAIRNDDLSAFDRIPKALGRGGRRRACLTAAELWLDKNGPHSELYKPKRNLLAGNPPLGAKGLAMGLDYFSRQVDASGQPIYVESVVLVVSSGLEVVANNLMNQVTIDYNEGSGTKVRVNNWIVGNLKLVVEPYAPIVAKKNGRTTWALFADPHVGRPALEIGFVSGFSQPRLYRKVSNAIAVGSGVIDQEHGDFSTMSQAYKGVIALGGARLDWRSTVASNGSGT